MKIAFQKGFNTKNWKNWVICLKTLSIYSHCELVFEDGTSFSAIPSIGIRFEEAKEFPKKEWDVYVISSDKLRESEKMIRSRARELIGAKYDWFGLLFNFVIELGINDPNKWFCSEVCGWLLHIRDSDTYSPGKLFKILKTNQFLV